jgi:hypothetical protein
MRGIFMRKIVLLVAIIMPCGVVSFAQQAGPQTARQALMEMFFSKTPGTFVKHLPVATRTALEKSGAMDGLQQYSTMAAQIPTDGKNLETFDTGSLMLVAKNPQTGDRVEVTVESDRLHGEQDEIAVAFHIYEKGKEKPTPYMPQMAFSMKQEAQVWKLNEISITIHLPLADPDLLKAIEEKMTPQAGAHVTLASQSAGTMQMPSSMPVPHSDAPMQPAGTDAQVIAAMRTILTAEATYAERYPFTGYTCSLSSLDGFGSGEPNEHQAMLINSGLASGKRYGFVFTINGCGAPPAKSFQLTAVPNSSVVGRKAFCADQSGVVKSAENGDAGACFASGTTAQ